MQHYNYSKKILWLLSFPNVPCLWELHWQRTGLAGCGVTFELFFHLQYSPIFCLCFFNWVSFLNLVLLALWETAAEQHLVDFSGLFLTSGLIHSLLWLLTGPCYYRIMSDKPTISWRYPKHFSWITQHGRASYSWVAELWLQPLPSTTHITSMVSTECVLPHMIITLTNYVKLRTICSYISSS